MSRSRNATAWLLAPLLTASFTACMGSPERHTLAELRNVEPDVEEVQLGDSLDQAMAGYRKFLEEAPESSLTPEAMRRLADLKLEKEYGLLGDGEIVEVAASEPPEGKGGRARAAPGGDAAALPAPATAGERPAASGARPEASGIADHSESEQEFERRTTNTSGLGSGAARDDLALPGGGQAAPAGPLEAIALYDQILESYPNYHQNDQVLYQKARALDELGRVDEAVEVIERLIAEYPHSRHIDEVQFRRAEYFFTRSRYLDAEEAYQAITRSGAGSDYYELALYKLGWTFYKQELHEEALAQYIALLDYKVSTGYDFEQSEDENDERRIADTLRVISLSFSSLGGPEVVDAWFASHGNRTYEDRIYSHLGEFYLEKLRYQDAAASYQAFVALHPLHRASPHFSMRVVEIYEAGGFPKLVLDSKKDFAETYALGSEYWRHFDVDEMPEVLHYLKSNLEDLASHYHALYQDPEDEEERIASFEEALRWYRAYLASFPEDPDTPAIHYRLADLLLEHEAFAAAAREYERTAYDYPAHEKASAAGYAAIFAHREHEKGASGAERDLARQQAVTSTLRFVDTFPEHEHAAAVLGAAADDLYAMQDYERAIANGRRLIEQYPAAEPSIRRAAWAVIAHASFDTNAYPEAEQAYGRVLALTPSDDERHQSVVDNLAAAIYQQGEQANEAEDHRAAADHFLRIAEAAPGSEIRPLAEYDAGAALIRLEAWEEAAGVLDRFRRAYPDHELNREATKQIAFIYREEGDLSRAAGEYERVAAEADDPELRREALLVAGELYEDSGAPDRALGAYRKYVQQFPEPLETAVETRFKIAEILEAQSDEAAYHDELRRIVEVDRAAGAARTPRIRYLAARSALVLSEQLYHRFDEIALVQPFQQSLKEKRQRMETALDAFRALVDYEVGEVTAAATFYMAEVYFDFSRSLLESERPADLAPAELQDYELVLEEEAFPFEERAITVHEKNLELMGTGVYNRWIEKSLGRLAVLMPGRYAKSEESSGFLTSLEQYAYVAPNAPDPEAPPAELAEGVPAAPAPTPAPAAAALPGPEPESAEIVPAPVAPQDAASAEPAPERTPAPEAPQQPENVVAPPVADAVEDAEPVQDAEAPDAAEAAESETAAVVEDAEVAETAPAAPEPEVAPEQAVAPEPEVAPEQAAAPEPEIAPEQAAAPEGEIAPEQAAAPEGEIVPEQAAAAEPEIAPESEVAPEPEIAPEQAAAPEPEIAPEPAAGAEQAAVPDPAPPAEAAAPEEDAESIEIEEPMPAAPAAPADVPPAAIAPEPPQVDHATP